MPPLTVTELQYILLQKVGEICNVTVMQFVMYEGHLESKERFAIKKIFIDNRKEKEYAGFITHLHLLLHIVTLGTEALVVP